MAHMAVSAARQTNHATGYFSLRDQCESSPDLTPSTFRMQGVQVARRSIDGMNVYDIQPGSGKGKADDGPKRKIYYLPGGGFIMPAQFFHWSYCATLVNHVPNATATLLSYPLAPQHSAPDCFDHIKRTLQTLFAESQAKGEQIFLVGESAGGNLVLTLALALLTEHSERSILPSAVLVISPAVDFHHANLECIEVERRDCMLTNAFCHEVGKAWAGTWSFDDPRVSPIKGDLSLFAKYNVRVHGVIAGDDVLAPDARLFVARCQEAGASGEWLIWENQPHAFPLGIWAEFSESTWALKWTVALMMEN